MWRYALYPTLYMTGNEYCAHDPTPQFSIFYRCEWGTTCRVQGIVAHMQGIVANCRQ